MQYSLPIKPSPNLQTTNRLIYTLACAFFEGTNVSVGRELKNNFKFMAHPICHKVISVYKTQYGDKTQCNGVACFGEDLSNEHRLLQL
jgi:uncharacterized protein YbbC (DUF1343 family)